MLDATTFGSEAIQQQPALLGSRQLGWSTRSEDCLHLNITAPLPSQGPYPVMVWLHPGAFVNGAGSALAFDGSALTRHGDVIVVTTNYRLGAFGWLHLGHRDREYAHSGNVGLLDQVAVLRWVHDNIASFGGDPTQVTVFGESSGAMCAAALATLPETRGLIRRLALQSGAAHFSIPLERAADLADRVMAGVGATEVSALLEVDPERLIEAQADAALAQGMQDGRANSLDRFLAWGPVVDGEVLGRRPIDAFAEGAGAEIDILVGSNRDEWNILDVEPAPSEPELHDWLARLVGPRVDDVLSVYRDSGCSSPVAIKRAVQADRLFAVPALRLAQARQRGGGSAPTFLYRFAWDRSRTDRGATHGAEVAFVFGHRWPWNVGQAGAIAGLTPPSDLVGQVHRAWLAFARTGDPNHDRLPPWHPWGDGSARLRFARPSEAESGDLEPRLAVWSGLL